MTLVSKYCRTGKPSPFQNRASSWAAAFTKTEVDELPLILAMLMPVAPDRFEMGMERAGPTLVVGSTSQVRVRPVRVFTKICMADFRSTRHKRQLEPTTLPVAATLHHDYYTDYTQKGSYNHDYHSIAHGGSYKITTVRRTSFYHFYLFG